MSMRKRISLIAAGVAATSLLAGNTAHASPSYPYGYSCGRWSAEVQSAPNMEYRPCQFLDGTKREAFVQLANTAGYSSAFQDLSIELHFITVAGEKVVASNNCYPS